MVGVVSDFERRQPGQRPEVIPNVTPVNRGALHAYLSVMLKVIEGFDPEPGHDHGSERDSYRRPTADFVDERLEDRLGKNSLPESVPDRPSTVPALFQRVRLDLLAIDRREQDGFRGKRIESLTSSSRVGILHSAHVKVMSHDVSDVAGAVEIADLRVMTNQPGQRATLVVELMRRWNQRQHRQPRTAQYRTGDLDRAQMMASHVPGHHQIQPGSQERAQPDRDVGDGAAAHAPLGQVNRQDAVEDRHDGQSCDA